MCHIKAIKRRRRECVCGRDGGQKIQLSLATRFKTAKIDSTMTLHRRLKSKECFLQLDQRGACRSALFICERNVHSLFFILFHYVELCAGSEDGAGPAGHAIKWFSRHSTSGWQSDKISSSLSHSPPPCPELQYHVK